MRTLLLSCVLFALSLTPATGLAPDAPVDWHNRFFPIQLEDCTTDPGICNDNNSCTTEFCMYGNCVYTVESGMPCSDGNACTSGDTCDSVGTCTGVLLTCQDGDLCTTDTCNPATGACVFPPKCDDGLLCTVDTCNSANGACTFAFEESLLVAPSVLISTADGYVKISWNSTGAENYTVHRSLDPYFVPAFENLVETVVSAPLVFNDPGVAADTRVNYDYQVVAMCLGFGKASQTVGEYGFELIQGQ